MLAAKGATGRGGGRPRDAAPVLARAPLERDRAFVEARAPDPPPLEAAPALEAPRGGRVAREVAALRVEVARVLVVVADALERDDARALLEAIDALAGVKAHEKRLVLEVIGDSWSEHRDALRVAQDLGAAIGVLSRAVDTVRRVPV